MDVSETEGPALMEDLLHRCQTLLDELNKFKTFIEKAKEQGPKIKSEYVADTKHFHAVVQTELGSLQKVG